MKTIALNIFMAFLSLVLALVAAEIILRTKTFSKPTISNLAEHEILGTYSAAERSLAMPKYLAEQGGDCTAQIAATPARWNQFFGMHHRDLDIGCLKSRFTAARHSLVLIGGSTMQNHYAPNYLTTIDSSIHSVVAGLESVNAAENGSIQRNGLVRLNIELIDLRPSSIAFMHGYNEFISIQYGAAPSQDYAWTVSVQHRIHNPLRFLLNAFTERSKVLQTLLWGSGMVASPRNTKEMPPREAIESAAHGFIRDTEATLASCRANHISCLFFLQPHLYEKSHLSEHEQQILKQTDYEFPHMREVLSIGYETIRSKLPSYIYDLAADFRTRPEPLFLDAVHLNKAGNKLVGTAIGRLYLDTDANSNIDH